MAGPKTSAELARDEAEKKQLDDMLGGAFGDMEAMKHVDPTPEASLNETPPLDGKPTGPPSGPPKGPPSGPPTGPPSGPPTGPPKDIIENVSASDQNQDPLLTSPLNGSTQLDEVNVDAEPEMDDHNHMLETQGAIESTGSNELVDAIQPSADDGPAPTDVLLQSYSGGLEHVDTATDPIDTSMSDEVQTTQEVDESEPLQDIQQLNEATTQPEPTSNESVQAPISDGEMERLHMENARLRQALNGATEVIQQLDDPAMPPIVEGNVVISSHVVGDFVRIGRQLDREHLVRATMGGLAMIHPEQHGIMIATRHMAVLPRLSERSLCMGMLGAQAPRGAPLDWRVMEVLLASVSMVTGGPAAAIHVHGPYTTTASCEKDLIVLNPLDQTGKSHIGKIVIIDQDADDPESSLVQIAEALNQGGMRCVVLRGNGAYAVGADFDQAWANAAMLEHSMQVHLLARQANIKV